jgi:prevent-host-death family protein
LEEKVKDMYVSETSSEIWQLQEAKARFSEVVKSAQWAPQTITVHGKEAAVIMSFENYKKLTDSKMSLYDALQSLPFRDVELNLERDKSTKMRKIDL